MLLPAWWDVHTLRAFVHSAADAFTIRSWTPMDTKGKSEIVSARVSPQTAVAIDKLAHRWHVDRSRTLCRLAEAADSPEVVALVEQVTFQREPTLPKSRRYRVVSDFKDAVRDH